MRSIMLGLVVAAGLLGAGGAKAGTLANEPATIQRIDWDGDRCGPRCQHHREVERHARWEAERRAHRHHWEERRYGNSYSRY